MWLVGMASGGLFLFAAYRIGIQCWFWLKHGFWAHDGLVAVFPNIDTGLKGVDIMLRYLVGELSVGGAALIGCLLSLMLWTHLVNLSLAKERNARWKQRLAERSEEDGT